MSANRLHVRGDGELAGALRILNLFAQRGLALRSVALTLGGDGFELAIDAGDADSAALAIIREKIAAMPFGMRVGEPVQR